MSRPEAEETIITTYADGKVEEERDPAGRLVSTVIHVHDGKVKYMPTAKPLGDDVISASYDGGPNKFPGFRVFYINPQIGLLRIRNVNFKDKAIDFVVGDQIGLALARDLGVTDTTIEEKASETHFAMGELVKQIKFELILGPMTPKPEMLIAGTPSFLASDDNEIKLN